MKHCLLVVPALALLGAAPPPGPPVAAMPQASPARIISPAPNVCKDQRTFAADPDGRAHMHRLGELPPAQAYMAVYRTDEKGCIDPMLASERLGVGRRP